MIVLLTDFGLKDAYVGVMKGIILSIAPSEQIIDLTHQIQAQNICHANTILIDNYQYFPKSTIFCCVVDPGVGTQRKSIVVKNKDYTFIGPDNGIFTSLIDEQSQVFQLFTPDSSSNTFHGRDLYAPSSAKLAMNKSHFNLLDQLDYKSCFIYKKLISNDEIAKRGDIIYSDHFGNLISNVKACNLRDAFRIFVNNLEVPFVKTYDEIRGNELGILFSSSGRLEIAVKNGSALHYFNKSNLKLFFDVVY